MGDKEAFTSLPLEEQEALLTCNPAELIEIARRCKVKAFSYLRSAAIAEGMAKDKPDGQH